MMNTELFGRINTEKIVRKFLKRLPDKYYLMILYKLKFNKKLDLKNPQTFNEKLQWLKLYDRKDIYTTMVDKYEMKKYIQERLGKEYVIPTLGIWNRFQDIEFSKLPEKFVLKCTHDSGSTIICEKSKIDYKLLKKTINKYLKQDFYYPFREWPYKNVKKRIMAEEFKEDYTGSLIDYKIYSFNGKCDYVMTCLDREKENEKTKFIYYDRNWNLKKEFSQDGMKYGDKINLKRPKNLEKMFEFASELSKGIPFVRVDFYEVEDKLYIGELTFFPSGGFDDTRTDDATKYLDEQLKISEK